MSQKFNALYESISNDLASLEEYETKQALEIVSLEEFKHFCKNLGIITQVEKNDQNKVVGCALFLADKFDELKNPIRFWYWNKKDKQYVSQYPELFQALNDYKQTHLVTFDGTADSFPIIWG